MSSVLDVVRGCQCQRSSEANGFRLWLLRAITSGKGGYVIDLVKQKSSAALTVTILGLDNTLLDVYLSKNIARNPHEHPRADRDQVVRKVVVGIVKRRKVLTSAQEEHRRFRRSPK